MKKIKIEVCTGTSCHLLGAYELKQFLSGMPTEMQQYLDICGVPCLQHCGHGPNVRINGTIYSNFTVNELENKIKDIIETID